MMRMASKWTLAAAMAASVLASVSASQAQKTIRNITGVDVVSMSATVDPNPGGIKEYRTTVNVAFVLEDS